MGNFPDCAITAFLVLIGLVTFVSSQGVVDPRKRDLPIDPIVTPATQPTLAPTPATQPTPAPTPATQPTPVPTPATTRCPPKTRRPSLIDKIKAKINNTFQKKNCNC